MKKIVYIGPHAGVETPWGTFKKGEMREVPDDHALDKVMFEEAKATKSEPVKVDSAVKKEVN